jgi:hypothetical protein
VRNPSNDNLTLLIIDLSAYYQDTADELFDSPVKPTFRAYQKQLKLREVVSEAGQTESVIFGLSSDGLVFSPIPTPKHLESIEVPINLRTDHSPIIRIDRIETPHDSSCSQSITSEADCSSQNSCHVQSLQNSVYAFFGDSPQSLFAQQPAV